MKTFFFFEALKNGNILWNKSELFFAKSGKNQPEEI
jgi:hypothetical protein